MTIPLSSNVDALGLERVATCAKHFDLGSPGVTPMLDLLTYLSAIMQPMPQTARATSETDCRPLVTMMAIGNTNVDAQTARQRSKARPDQRRPSTRPCLILASS
jgi:hypothetical protein